MQKLNSSVIMFDGPDGVGKSTQLKLALENLKQQGCDVYTTRVHGGTPIGEALRQVSLMNLPRPGGTDLHISLAMYYALAEEIDKKRLTGTVCLIDRSPLSIIGYQVYGSGLDPDIGYSAAQQALKLIRPDLLICYMAAPKTLLRRRTTRENASSAGDDYFEHQSSDYMKRVTEGYLQAGEKFQATLLSADASVQEIHLATMQHIDALLVT